MKKLFITGLFTVLVASAFGQSALFGVDSSVKAHRGFILNGNFTADIPLLDMAKRFGFDYRLGPSISYKTTSNWIFGVKTDFILGNNIKEDSLLINVRDRYATNNGKLVEFININGNRIGIPIYERGYMIGLSAGKIFNNDVDHPDNGWEVLTTAGFMQHKINIFDKDFDVAQVDYGYKKGYDRLTNGAFVEQFVGYMYFAKNKLINFNIGVDAVFGFTQGRRDYLFDVMRADNAKRKDWMVGLRAAWMIPIFKRKSEDISFE